MLNNSETCKPDDTFTPTLLVVDDEAGIREMVSLSLKQSGYTIRTACNAAEGWNIFDSEPITVVITDVMMPGDDGISLLGKIHRKSPEVPVIIMTGYAQLHIAVNAIKNGAFDFIHKPFDFSYLRTVVDKAFRYYSMLRLEKQYMQELERTVEERTSELSSALQQLDHTHVALAKALNEKSAFMATISHEMRTPMNGVIGGLDLLADAGLTGAQTNYLSLTRKAADAMLELVERMLSFSDGAGRRLSANQVQIELVQFLADVIEKHRSEFSAKELTVSYSAKPAKIRCDAEQVERLLEILLNNACKFTDTGGATVEAELLSRENRSFLRIAVRDTGIGIPEEKLDMIFEPFTQIDRSSTRRFAGAGLGLCIARNIVSQLRGNVQVESAPGHGSYFCCELPCEVDINGEKL